MDAIAHRFLQKLFQNLQSGQTLRWVKVVNPRNWGPSLKEWGLSVAKK